MLLSELEDADVFGDWRRGGGGGGLVAAAVFVRACTAVMNYQRWVTSVTVKGSDAVRHAAGWRMSQLPRRKDSDFNGED